MKQSVKLIVFDCLRTVSHFQKFTVQHVTYN